MILAYTGKTGSMKTFQMIKDAYKQWKRGRNIYSNTKLEFESQPLPLLDRAFKLVGVEPKRGNIKYFETINEIIDIKDGLILFDEAQVLFNARQWESLPEEFQYKLQQHRKHQIDLICTTQNMGTIDISYRRLVHQWIHCENMFQIGKSPRIWIGLFWQNFKDIDYLYNSVDDLTVPTIKKKFKIIHYFSRRLYDTMFDIGFRKFKTVWLSWGLKQNQTKMALIMPKKMKISKAITEIKMMQNLKKLSFQKQKLT